MKRATQSHWLRQAYMSKTALVIPSGCFWASVQQRWHHCSTLRLCRPFFIASQSFDWVAFFTICTNYLHVIEEYTKFFILHFYTPYFHTHESRGGQTAYDKCPKRVLCNRAHTHLRSDNLVQRVPSRFGHSHSVFYVTKGMEHLCPPEMPFSYSQQITSIPLMCQMWEVTFLQCHAAEVKHQCSVEGTGTSGPVKQEARCCLKSLVLCSVSYLDRLLK